MPCKCGHPQVDHGVGGDWDGCWQPNCVCNSFNELPGEQPGAAPQGGTSAPNTQQEGTHSMTTTNTTTGEKMTAKKAIAILKGELGRMKAEFAVQKLMEQRLVRADGADPAVTAETYDKATARVEAAYNYALAALALSKASKKSALKELERQGIPHPNAPQTVPPVTAQPQRPVDPPPSAYSRYGQTTAPSYPAPTPPSAPVETDDDEESEEDDEF